MPNKRKPIQSIYVSGPMSGVPHYNFPAFAEATETLRKQGFTVTSPAEKDIEKGIEPDPTGNPIPKSLYDKLLAEDLEIVREVDAVVVLKGWTRSHGAKTEIKEALDNGKTVLMYPSMKPMRTQQWLRVTNG